MTATHDKLPSNLNYDTCTGLRLSAQRLLFTVLHSGDLYRDLQSARHFHNGGERGAFIPVITKAAHRLRHVSMTDRKDVREYLEWQCDHDEFGEYTGAGDLELADMEVYRGN